MATRPVKVLPDLQTKKQIIKVDSSGNELFKISGTLDNGYVSSSLPISASSGLFISLETTTSSSFYNINVATSSVGNYKIYDVNQAFHAVDDSLSSFSSVSFNSYKRLRYQVTGNFDINGSVDISLPLSQFGGNAFPVSSIDFINVSVAIKENNSWYNDIVSINLTSSGGQVHVIIDAPALNNTNQYRFLAVNENPSDYVA